MNRYKVKANITSSNKVRQDLFSEKDPYETFECIGECPISKELLLIIPNTSKCVLSYNQLNELGCKDDRLDFSWIGTRIAHINKNYICLVEELSSNTWTRCTGCGYESPLAKINHDGTYMCRNCATAKGIMASGKYKIGDKVLCRVRPKKRVVFDDPYGEGYLLESRPFLIIGDGTDGSYIVLIEDKTLASWPIGAHHLKDHHIDSTFKGKNAYNVFSEAIGGIAPRINICDNCKTYNNNLKKKLESEESPMAESI